MKPDRVELLKRLGNLLGGVVLLFALNACAGPVTRVQVRCEEGFAIVVVKLEDRCEAYVCHRGRDCSWLATGSDACDGWIE